jgi:hypothetical protein
LLDFLCIRSHFGMKNALYVSILGVNYILSKLVAFEHSKP